LPRKKAPIYASSKFHFCTAVRKNDLLRLTFSQFDLTQGFLSQTHETERRDPGSICGDGRASSCHYIFNSSVTQSSKIATNGEMPAAFTFPMVVRVQLGWQ
jgi:hypothetical protein